MTPGEAALSDNGQFLTEEAEALRRRIRTLPPLPAGNGIPAVLALARRIVREGQKKGQLRTDMTEGEIVRAYALWERALMYDWCLTGGDYSLVAWTDRMTPAYLQTFASKQ